MLNHPAFKPLPHLAQFAKNGSWETAWSFRRTALPSQAEIRKYLASANEVAFEAFFGDAFFGARLSGESGEVEKFSLACTATLEAATNGASFFSHLREIKAFHGLGQGQPIASVEIGAVNAWHSVGAFKSASPQEALREFEALWTSLASIPLARDSSHRKAIEFNYLLPLHHWFGFPVSSSSPPFELNSDQLHQALEFVIGS